MPALELLLLVPPADPSDEVLNCSVFCSLVQNFINQPQPLAHAVLADPIPVRHEVQPAASHVEAAVAAVAQKELVAGVEIVDVTLVTWPSMELIDRLENMVNFFRI